MGCTPLTCTTTSAASGRAQTVYFRYWLVLTSFALHTALHTTLHTALHTALHTVPQFCLNLAHISFTMNKCAQFSSFLILLKKRSKKIRFQFEYWETFYEGFPSKKKKSMRILCKMNPDQIQREFLFKITAVGFRDDDDDE